MPVALSYHRRLKWVDSRTCYCLDIWPETFRKQLLVESKEQALDVKINLPVVPRLRRAVTNDEVEEFYVTLFEKAFRAAANSL